MANAASVPSTTEITVESSATRSDTQMAFWMLVLPMKSSYQLSVKPPQRPTLRSALKENTTSRAMGA